MDIEPGASPAPARRLLGQASAAMVPLLLLLSACTAASPSAQASPSPSPSLDRYYQQKAAFAPCKTPLEGTKIVVDGECGQVEVPLNYQKPDGDVARIAVFRVAARGDKKIGSLFLNPGGPGYPGVGYAAMISATLAKNPVSERFDIVGFDPRGTGASKPALDCFDNTERDADVTPGSQLISPGAPPLVQACADSVGGADKLAHFGTRDAARDLDILRAVLGDEKLTYAGASYGTRLGPVYAEMFPDKVRALVLDGALDPHANTLQRRQEQWASFQQAFDEIAAFCIAKGDCPLGDDVKGATAEYQKLARPLLSNPVPAGNSRRLSFIAANDGIVTGLYAQRLWPQVVAGLAELKKGRGEILLALRDSYHRRSPNGQYDNSVEANYAIDCLDEDRFSPRGTAELTQKTLAAAPFLDPGTPVKDTPDWCEGWPSEPTLGFPYATGIPNLPPTLTISVTGDALTPHAGGVSLAKTLGGGLLTVEGKQHGTMLAANACVDAAIATYLIDLKVPAQDATCRL
ncbi:alpha/beta hydrolase [Paractinoplanes maris]|uniref:alpha/beta hydrolase n=1 Tax=Paractinoplanes maris TaxID=1734446 RepID=UPI00201FC5FC|nr:alpha/beta hydrolase [Actinoplanes maris]